MLAYSVTDRTEIGSTDSHATSSLLTNQILRPLALEDSEFGPESLTLCFFLAPPICCALGRGTLVKGAASLPCGRGSSVSHPAIRLGGLERIRFCHLAKGLPRVPWGRSDSSGAVKPASRKVDRRVRCPAQWKSPLQDTIAGMYAVPLRLGRATVG